jgi:phosphoribosyl 1,2-cyclic phosphate phosphodiesterase
MRITVLGCGHSGGTPLIGGGWGACDPDNPRNRRLRPSILVEDGETRILVDTSPDLRQQLLNASMLFSIPTPMQTICTASMISAP